MAESDQGGGQMPAKHSFAGGSSSPTPIAELNPLGQSEDMKLSVMKAQNESLQLIAKTLTDSFPGGSTVTTATGTAQTTASLAIIVDGQSFIIALRRP